jgi:lipopolysaccharide/colanic/teichoic acid biosynthesis glycosyltransferase
MYRHLGKRLLDVSITLPGLCLALPILLLVAVLLYFFQGRTVLFKQARPGQFGKLFIIYKFKTMSDACGPDGTLLPDADRLTALGRFIRKYSLDELPQLWNIVRGDLSLVGPRPLLPEYLPLFTPEQARRHLVKPGITGWAQVNGRNALTWEQKFAYDVWYVEHLSFLLDLKIMARTFIKLFNPTGIQAPGSATAERFTGTAPHVT